MGERRLRGVEVLELDGFNLKLRPEVASRELGHARPRRGLRVGVTCVGDAGERECVNGRRWARAHLGKLDRADMRGVERVPEDGEPYLGAICRESTPLKVGAQVGRRMNP